jgi:hypothetical protein
MHFSMEYIYCYKNIPSNDEQIGWYILLERIRISSILIFLSDPDPGLK